MENAMVVYTGYIGTMEEKLETTTVYWGFMGIMEKQMKTTISGSGFRGIGTPHGKMIDTDLLASR